MKYVCELCGFVYDQENGVPFANLPLDYTCPVCGSEKEAFTQAESGAAHSTGNANRYDSQR